MSNEPILESFISQVQENQTLWGLQDANGDGWVVCDSADFEQTDVMPIWSTPTQAEHHCTQEWSDYQAVAISLNDFLEEWVGDLNEDGVLLGINWVENQTCLEIDPIELAKALVKVEAD